MTKLACVVRDMMPLARGSDPASTVPGSSAYCAAEKISPAPDIAARQASAATGCPEWTNPARASPSPHRAQSTVTISRRRSTRSASRPNSGPVSTGGR